MITFQVIDATFNLRHKNAIKNWIKEIIRQKNRKTGDINYIFADDSYVLNVNREFLGHDFYTDIITFDTSGYGVEDTPMSETDQVYADIVISLDTVSANGSTYGAGFSRELYRVMAHGILHLTGYDDIDPEDAKEMRRQEDLALSLLADLGIPDDQKYISTTEQ